MEPAPTPELGAPPPEPAAAAPPYRLFSLGQVVLAAILGMPIAGCILMAINRRRLGQGMSVRKLIVLGVVATAILVALAYVMPAKSPAFPTGFVGFRFLSYLAEKFPALYIGILVGFLGLLFAWYLAEKFQGPLINAHTARGGRKASWWVAVGVGAASSLAILAVCVGVGLLFDLLSTDDLGTCISFPPNDNLHIRDETHAVVRTMRMQPDDEAIVRWPPAPHDAPHCFRALRPLQSPACPSRASRIR